MDIDILQVQETVTVDTNGSIVFPAKDDQCHGISDMARDMTTPDILQVI